MYIVHTLYIYIQITLVVVGQVSLPPALLNCIELSDAAGALWTLLPLAMDEDDESTVCDRWLENLSR